jgi:hypothetical protein
LSIQADDREDDEHDAGDQQRAAEQAGEHDGGRKHNAE